jgi:hypothetical protein
MSGRKSMTKISVSILLLSGLLCFSNVAGQVAAGGVYTLDRAVIATSGGTSADGGGLYKVESTAGQTAGGVNTNAGAYLIRGGFWTPNSVGPTAANASIGGRVVDANGAGLRNITVTLSGGNLLTPRITRTSSLGYFTLDDVMVGQTYFLGVENRKYSFQQPIQVVSLMDSISDIVFQAAWGK